MKMGKLNKARTMFLLGVMSLAGPLAATADEADDYMARMEKHWQNTMETQDPQRRQAMLAEHAEMMKQGQMLIDREQSQAGHMGMGGMNHHGHYMDLQNTIDLHRHMMDMMH